MKQTDKVLNYIRLNGQITTLEAVTELGVLSLPRRIMELRRAGYPIRTSYKVTSKGVKYGVYTLNEEA